MYPGQPDTQCGKFLLATPQLAERERGWSGFRPMVTVDKPSLLSSLTPVACVFAHEVACSKSTKKTTQKLVHNSVTTLYIFFPFIHCMFALHYICMYIYIYISKCKCVSVSISSTFEVKFAKKCDNIRNTTFFPTIIFPFDAQLILRNQAGSRYVNMR